MKVLLVVALAIVAFVAFSNVAMAAGGSMVCRLQSCQYSDVNGIWQTVGYGTAVYYYRSLGQGFVYEAPQTSQGFSWGSNNYSGQPGDLLGLRCGLFNQNCR